MSIAITEVRNAQSLQSDNLRMDVEINHPTHGWIPYTLDPSDTDTTINNDEIMALINTDFSAYVAPTQEELDALADVIATKKDFYVICDEIYELINYTGVISSLAKNSKVTEQVITVNGLSKGFAMTGFRVGFACGPDWLIEAMMKIHQYSMLCAPIMSQRAAIEALKGGRKLISPMKQRYHSRRDFMIKAFHEMGLECVVPEGAFYAFPKVSSTGLMGKEFALKFLEQYKVAVVPGEAFGEAGQEYIRCCYAESMEVIKEALDRMKQFIDKLPS